MPNYLEIIGLMINFIATIVIVTGDKLLRSFGFCIEELEPVD